MQNQKWQTGVRSLLLFILCCGVIAWAWRRLGDSNRNPTTTGDWVYLAGSGDVDERKLALQKLEPVNSSEVAAAIDVCTRALKDPDAGVRSEAAIALGRLATPRPPVPGAMEPEQVRGVAQLLVAALREDRDSGVRASAATGLSAIFSALVKSGTRPETFPEGDPLRPETLVAQFDAGLQSDPSIRVPLITAIERLGTVPMAAPPGLLSTLNEPVHSIRGRTLLALSHFSGEVDPAIPILLGDVVTNTDRFPPDYAAIARAMHPSPAVAPALLDALKSKNGIVRETAATLLTRVEPPPKSVAPAVIAAVKEALSFGDGGGKGPDADSRQAAPPEGGIGPRASNRREPPPPGAVSPDLAIAVAKFAPPGEALPLLLQLLKRKDSGSRNAAAEGLAEMGPAAHPAIPALIATLKEATRGVGGAGAGYGASTARALGRIVPQSPGAQSSSPEVIAVLTDALNGGPTSIRSSAAQALGDFGPKAAPAIPRLKALAKDRVTPIREAAESALKQIEPQSTTGKDAKPS